MANRHLPRLLIACASAVSIVASAEPVTTFDIEPYLPRAAHSMSDLRGSAPLTLETLVRIALDQNPLQRAASEGVAAAEEAVGVARAPYYPSVSMEAGYRRWETHAFLPDGLGGPNPPTTIGPGDDWSLGLKAGYIVYDGGERSAKLRAALAGRTEWEQQAESIRQQIVFEVHRAYYSALSAHDARSVAGKGLSRAEDHLRLARERKAAGAVPLADVMRAQVEVSNSRLALVHADATLGLVKGNLNAVLGLPVDLAIQIDTSSPSFDRHPDMPLTEALDRAAQARPELAAAVQRVSLREASVDAARSAYFPKLKAEAGFGWRDSEFPPGDKDWSAGLSVQLPLFSGHSQAHGLARAKAELAKEKAEVRQLVLKVQQEVQLAHSGIREARQTVEAAASLLADAEESLRLARERYNVGAGTIADLLDAETSVEKAETVMVDARYDERVAQANLLRAIGEVKQTPGLSQ